MPTLHIEHAISDFDLWRGAFERFEQYRTQAGVRAERIQRPVDDPQYVVIDLDFDRDCGGEVPGFPHHDGVILLGQITGAHGDATDSNPRSRAGS
ncbi:MAG: hypothetical protein ACR2I7_05445 [Geodermatophilaceae bacterium]